MKNRTLSPDMLEGAEERFLIKVLVKGEDECWPFIGCRTPKDYGLFQVKTKTPHMAHRVMYVLSAHETIETDDVIMHTCDRPSCCNPRHLVKGTQKENIQDKMNKGRDCLRFGEHNHCAKLTAENVIDIRTRFKKGGITQRELGEEYGLKHQSISDIVRRRNWAHVA